jgi:hypothetical protein
MVLRVAEGAQANRNRNRNRNPTPNPNLALTLSLPLPLPLTACHVLSVAEGAQERRDGGARRLAGLLARVRVRVLGLGLRLARRLAREPRVRVAPG